MSGLVALLRKWAAVADSDECQSVAEQYRDRGRLGSQAFSVGRQGVVALIVGDGGPKSLSAALDRRSPAAAAEVDTRQRMPRGARSATGSSEPREDASSAARPGPLGGHAPLAGACAGP